MDREKVVVAEIRRPRGNRGEVLACSQTDVPGRLESLKTATVRLADGQDIPVEITEAWAHRDGWVLKFAGIDSIGAAERFRGSDLWVPLVGRGMLAEGDFFRSDLIGCHVLDRLTGGCVGTVGGWQQYGGGPPLMEVETAKAKCLIPFVDPMCKVDLAARTIWVELPEGLLDL